MLQSSLPPSPRAGGVGRQVHLLATALVRSGDDVTVFVADEAPSGTVYTCVPVPLGADRGRRLMGVGWRFARLDLSGFDVVHAHGDDWLMGGRPRLRTFYGSAFMEARTATTARRTLAQACYYALEWISSVNASSVGISRSTLRYLPLVRSCVPCAYDPGEFFPAGTRTPEPSILFVAGTLQGRKRGDLLLRAFRNVRDRVPEARLTVVSHDQVREPGVTCVSGLDGRSLGDLYRSHWLLCSTSSYEGFGVPYVEALASGLPVVATRNEGASEVLEGGALGVLCSADGLASEIVSLLADPGRRDRMASAGLVAAERYAIDVVAATYRSLYRQVAAAPTTGSGRGRWRTSDRASSQPSSSQGRGATA